MSLTGIAALIAAVSFAVLAGAGVYLAVRFTRVLGDAATLVRDTRSDQQALFARANTAVDRANAQLDLTEAATASVGELGTAMTELAGQASALAGVGRTVAGAVVGGPLGRAAAVAYGVRHAVGVRTGTRQRRPLAGQVVAGPELPPAPPAHRRRRRQRPQSPEARPQRQPAAAAPGRSGPMIRRGFWLAVGATGGIMGYRRVSSLGRRLSATLSPAAPREGAEQPAGGQTTAGASRGGRPPLSGRARRGLVRGTIRFTRDARMFSRDVREGMDLYMVRHRAQGSPTLGRSAHPPLHQPTMNV